VDVTTATEVGLSGAEDEEQIAFALAQDRVVVTQNQLVLRHYRSGVSHAGIAFSQHKLRSIGALLRGLILLNDCLESEDMRNHGESL
jgi:hypothetical protein